MTENQLHGVVCDPSSLATQTTEYRSGKNALLLDGVSSVPARRGLQPS